MSLHSLLSLDFTLYFNPSSVCSLPLRVVLEAYKARLPSLLCPPKVAPFIPYLHDCSSRALLALPCPLLLTPRVFARRGTCTRGRAGGHCPPHKLPLSPSNSLSLSIYRPLPGGSGAGKALGGMESGVSRGWRSLKKVSQARGALDPTAPSLEEALCGELGKKGKGASGLGGAGT